MKALLERTAGAPISWGVCEVPGWGAQLPAARVLSEMSMLGLSATELGPVGYLPTDRSELRDVLDAHGLSLTGGFNALALANPEADDAVMVLAAESADLLAGLFPPLGEGDLPIGETVSALEHAGYEGWYVIEQDVSLTHGEPAAGEGPILGVGTSVTYLRSLALGPASDASRDVWRTYAGPL